MDAEPTSELGEQNRTEQVHFRVTIDEKRAIEAKSVVAGYKKVSDYLRTLGLQAEVKEVMPPELRRQLVGIGTNLNQIARRVQSNSLYNTDERKLMEAVEIIRSYLL